jgi:hypothetical protein
LSARHSFCSLRTRNEWLDKTSFVIPHHADAALGNNGTGEIKKARRGSQAGAGFNL